MMVELTALDRVAVRSLVFDVPKNKGKQMRRIYPFKDMMTRRGRKQFLVLHEPTRMGYIHVQEPDGTKGYLNIWTSRILEHVLTRWKGDHPNEPLKGRVLEFENDGQDRPRFHVRVLK